MYIRHHTPSQISWYAVKNLCNTCLCFRKLNFITRRQKTQTQKTSSHFTCQKRHVTLYAGLQGSEGNDAKLENGFSQLKVRLGDTLDMILPFLDDLDNHRQQTPSSDANHDRKQLTQSSNAGSPVISENGYDF